MPNPSPFFPSFHLCKNHPLPVPCCEKMHLLWLIFFTFSSLKILIKKTCLYIYVRNDDLFFQAKKHCVLDLSINITCLNKLCWSLSSKQIIKKLFKKQDSNELSKETDEESSEESLNSNSGNTTIIFKFGFY